MSRYRIKTLLNAVWSVLDAEFETAETGTVTLEHRAKEIALRNTILETLDNSAFKGKRLVKEIECLVRELVRMKREHAQQQPTEAMCKQT